ncbi:MAG: PAS domain S-box protein, partial [Bacteroidetes bacterium]|nr:PAS domain S-box protein [Bacteroidota bacterium]
MKDENKTKEQLIEELKELREQSAKSELMKLNRIIENSPVIAYTSTIDENFGTTYVSKNITRIIGYQPEDLISDPEFMFKHIHPDDIERVTNELDSLFEKGSVSLKYRFQIADGSYRWIIDSSRRVESNQDNPGYIEGWIYDITEQVLASEKYNLFFHSIVDGVILQELVVDDNGDFYDMRYIDINSTAEKIIQKSKGEIFGKLVKHDVFPHSNVELLLLHEKVCRTGQSERIETHSKIVGRYFDVSIFQFAKNKTATIFKDITELKQAEEQLKQSEARFRTMTESSPFGVFLVDVEGKNVYSNPAQIKISGLSLEEALGNGWASVIHPEDVQWVSEKWKIALKEDTPFDEVLRYLRKNGKVIWVHNIITKIIENEIHLGYVSIVEDITKQKKIENQFRQASKMEALGTLAGGIAHDFNNILVSILGNAELGLMELSQDRQERAYFENILESGERAANLVRQIVTFSRMEAIRLKSVNLASIISEALKIARATIPTNIEISQDLLEECPNIMADATQIYQIILNLCTNAYHAMEETGGVLEVTLKEVIDPSPALEMKAGNYLELSVKDKGCGISKEDQERMFDPFFTTKEVGKGTGLGLAVVFGIVEKHQGKITVDSKIDKGTTISIIFPT